MSYRRFVRASTSPVANAPTISAEPAFFAASATSSANATDAAHEDSAHVRPPDDPDRAGGPGDPSASADDQNPTARPVASRTSAVVHASRSGDPGDDREDHESQHVVDNRGAEDDLALARREAPSAPRGRAP